MRQIEDQNGAFVVLENLEQRIVGAAVFKRFDTFHEQHTATLSFRVCPSYFGQVPELLTAAAEKAQALSIRALQVHIAACDDEQKQLAKNGGISRRNAFVPSTVRWEKFDRHASLHLIDT